MRLANTFIALGLAVVMAGGCARAARDTTGFAMTDSATVNADFDTTWETVKAILREMDLELYTRDTRGVFVAYGDVQRNLLLVPRRVEYTVRVQPVSANSTEVRIESQRQVYGSTPLTYPDWHNRPTTDNSDALAILEALRERLS